MLHHANLVLQMYVTILLTLHILILDAFVTTAREVLPAKAKSVKQNWITGEILNLMENRRKSKGVNDVLYQKLNKDIKKKCTEEKEKWWNKQCEEIEGRPSEASKKIKGMKKSFTCSSTGCITARDG